MARPAPDAGTAGSAVRDVARSAGVAAGRSRQQPQGPAWPQHRGETRSGAVAAAWPLNSAPPSPTTSSASSRSPLMTTAARPNCSLHTHDSQDVQDPPTEPRGSRPRATGHATTQGEPDEAVEPLRPLRRLAADGGAITGKSAYSPVTTTTPSSRPPAGRSRLPHDHRHINHVSGQGAGRGFSVLLGEVGLVV